VILALCFYLVPGLVLGHIMVDFSDDLPPVGRAALGVLTVVAWLPMLVFALGLAAFVFGRDD
jgi:hypothetical protein